MTEYLDGWRDREGIDIDESELVHNPGARLTAKILLNSLCKLCYYAVFPVGTTQTAVRDSVGELLRSRFTFSSVDWIVPQPPDRERQPDKSTLSL